MIARRVIQRYLVASLPTAKVPTTLFHGTRVDLDGPPRGPAWLSPSESIAESYAVEHGRGWVYTFKVKGSPRVARILNDEDALAVLQAIGWEVHHRIRPLSYFVSGPNSAELSSKVCKLGIDGWLVERRAGRVEVMLCEPSKFVTLVNRRSAEDNP